MLTFTKHPTKIKSTGIAEAIMENGGVNFTMSNAPDTVILQFAALVLSPTVQEATGEALDEDEDDNIELVVRPPLSPRKPKSKPGPKRQATADLSRKFPPPATHPTREKRAFTTAYKLGVLSYATYGRVDDGKGGLRAPRAKEVCTAGSVSDAFSAGSARTSKGKLPVEPVSLARRSRRLEGVRR